MREGQLLAERGRKETSTTPTPAAPTGGGGRGQGAGSEQQGSKGSKETNSVDRLTAYSERLEEFIKTLELLNQHVGTRMLRQQRSRTLVSGEGPGAFPSLPLEGSRECLFVNEGNYNFSNVQNTLNCMYTCSGSCSCSCTRDNFLCSELYIPL